MRTLRVVTVVVAFAALGAWAVPTGVVSAHQEPPDAAAQHLFNDLGADTTPADPSWPLSNRLSLRSRYVRIDFAALRQPKVVLDLFNGGTLGPLTAVWDSVEHVSSDSRAFAGHLEGLDHSGVTFTVDETAGVAQGSITFPGGLYRVRFVAPGVHVIEHLDSGAFPEDIVVPVPNLPSDPEDADVGADDASTIDVLVVYSPAARTAAGGAAAMNALVDLAIVETNASYAGSGITQRLRLVYKGEIAYTESGDFLTDLNRLTGSGDGYMDDVHGLRNTYGADLVSLIVESSQFCGIAWLLSPVTSAFAGNAFSVVARTCATGYYSFGHELGHNMGARHDWFVDPTNNSAFTYNHGFVATTKTWRTMMAYGDDCGGCTRIQRWSNPDLAFAGVATGVAEGLFHAADNRKVLNTTAPTVANFRQSVSVAAPVAPTVTSPAPGSTLNTNAVTFIGGHTASDLQHTLAIGTSPGGNTLWNQDLGTGHSATVTGLPNTGTIYVRYSTRFSDGRQFTDQSYTMSVVVNVAPSITSPAPSSTLTTTSVSFTGGHAAGDLQHALTVGTSPGGSNLWNQDLGTAHTTTVTGLPNSGTIYVRYSTRFSDGWQFTDQTYTMSVVVNVPQPITLPAPNSILTTTSVSFTGGHTSAELQHALTVGTSPGGSNLWNQDLGTAHTTTVTGLPKTGTIYVRYSTRFSNGWLYTDQTYTMSIPVNVPPPIASPAPGSILTTNSVSFTGGHTSAELQHALTVGTTPGGNNLWNQDLGAAHTTTVTGLPNTGTIYVRYSTRFSDGWLYTDQSYTMSGPTHGTRPITSPKPARRSSPGR